ncbi:unnamed protein product (macronuclear) [Paramecium tetraurelia]|uniref:RNase III domain-containing protein n=1 Tax=Paramecium tetraurelia TaxID=5888 RepID=A0BSJ2_PARTE|nr:uncharacterized protein GSPATT00031741001 [Paramecium tetraurelia]CAK61509.1 unnamed protein product [Paramecium tetraurelia]|eukprot:XP_001428907.1 hypothetical protein (macronuclear) [Paramecium tetraurelia strain d4-2]
MNNRIFRFQNINILAQALTNKIHELEFQSKKGIKYPFGNNEEFVVIGQMILEFYFSDYLIQRGYFITLSRYPNKDSSIKKPSDIVQLRQRLLNEKNLADIALQYSLPNIVQIGNQTALKRNPKILAESLKAILAAQYYDSGFDLEHVREITQPLFKELLDKGQNIPIAELKQNAKSSFLEFINNFTDLKPKVSIEWKKDANSANVFKVQLELDSLLNITRTGINKRQTEQLVYHEALMKLKQKTTNQYNLPLKSEIQKNVQNNESSEQSTIIYELERSILNDSQTFEFSEVYEFSNTDYQESLSNKVEQLLEKLAF